MMFLPIQTLELVEMRLCRKGLFFPNRDANASPLLLNVEDDYFQLVHLSAGADFAAVSGDRNRLGSESGFFINEPRVEVDLSTRFDPSRSEPEAGDIVIVERRISIVATPQDQTHSDTITVPLWGKFDVGGDPIGGFQRWRLVVGEGDRRQVVWSEQPGG